MGLSENIFSYFTSPHLVDERFRKFFREKDYAYCAVRCLGHLGGTFGWDIWAGHLGGTFGWDIWGGNIGTNMKFLET